MKLSERIDGTLYVRTDPENVLFDGLDDLDPKRRSDAL